jgi:hypothetical protein
MLHSPDRLLRVKCFRMAKNTRQICAQVVWMSGPINQLVIENRLVINIRSSVIADKIKPCCG